MVSSSVAEGMVDARSLVLETVGGLQDYGYILAKGSDI